MTTVPRFCSVLAAFLLTGCPAILPGEHAERIDQDQDGYDATGYADGTDCDDSDPAINPDAQESCGDGVDNNCDGSANSCGMAGTLSLKDADIFLRAEEAKDRLGASIAPAGDVDGDGTADLLIGGNTSSNTIPGGGVAYVVLGPAPAEGRQSIKSVALRLAGASQDEAAGSAVAGAGDLDNDGYADVLVGAPTNSANSTNKVGAWYMVNGPIGSNRTLSASDSEGHGVANQDRLGSSVAGGNFGGSTEGDIAAGAPFAADGGSDAGGVYVMFGPNAGTRNANKADATLTGTAGDLVGTSLASGDMDGDGQADLVIGAPGYDGSATDAGSGFVMLSPIGGVVNLATSADGFIKGMAAKAEAGTVVAVGDFDGDGQDDMVVGAPGADGVENGAGRAYLVSGPITGGAPPVASAMGQTKGDGVGSAIGVGDVNGDGVSDLLLGAPTRDVTQTDNGAVYLLYGPIEGNIGLGNANAKLSGENDDDNAGTAVGASDWDVNGSDDIFVGAPNSDDQGNNSGLVYTFLISGL